MAKVKTAENEADVSAFIEGIADETKREDCRRLLELMKDAIGCDPKMWGSTMVGFGSYHYKYESGREGDWFRIGFSPRKQNLTIYVMDGFEKRKDLMEKLGKHSTGKSCLYVKKLEQIDADVLREIIDESLSHFDEKYGPNES